MEEIMISKKEVMYITVKDKITNVVLRNKEVIEVKETFSDACITLDK